MVDSHVSNRQAGADAQVTPEMIEAGIKAYEACESPYLDELVQTIFDAMTDTSRNRPKGQTPSETR